MGRLPRSRAGVDYTDLVPAIRELSPDVVAVSNGPLGMRQLPRAAALAADCGLLLLAGGRGSAGALVLGQVRVQEADPRVLAVGTGQGWAAAALTIGALRVRLVVLADHRRTEGGGFAARSAYPAMVRGLYADVSAAEEREPGVPWLVTGAHLAGPARHAWEDSGFALTAHGPTVLTASSGRLAVHWVQDPAVPTLMALLELTDAQG